LAWALGARSKRAGDVLAVWRGRLLAVHPAQRLALVRQRLNAAERQLEAMSYRGVLWRGFSVTRKADGAILRSRADAVEGDWITTELADGMIRSRLGEPDGGTTTDHKLDAARQGRREQNHGTG
jgi:exonuclease VII large subunit